MHGGKAQSNKSGSDFFDKLSRGESYLPTARMPLASIPVWICIDFFDQMGYITPNRSW